MSKLTNRVQFTLDGGCVIVPVKDESEARAIIEFAAKHKSQWLLETSMTTCPVVIDYGKIVTAVYFEGEKETNPKPEE